MDEKYKVLTVYGHDRAIGNISIRSFDDSSSAAAYCFTISCLELNDNSWVTAREISESEQYPIDAFMPIKFDIILSLDDLSIQKMLREIDSLILATAMKGENEIIKEKIFSNLSSRAIKFLKEDIEYIGKVPIKKVKEAQEKIILVIHHLEKTGEIVINYSQGETVK